MIAVPFFRPSLGPDEEEAVLRVMRSGWLTTGAETQGFEADFARFLGVPHCLAVNSATSGLLLAYQTLGVGPEGAIITTPYTFASTATMALQLGARVIYAVEAGSYNIDPKAVEKRLEEAKKAGHRVAAIVAVHVAGLPADMAAICELGKRYAVPVVEDAAHAFPAKTRKGYAGTLGDMGVFSFYATKTITTGEGGMVCIRDEALAKRFRSLRSHGIDRPVWDRYTSHTASSEYDITDLGWKANLPDILAALGRVQLTKAQDMLKKRSAIAARFNDAFAPYDFLRIPPDGDGNAWHLYLLRIVQEKLAIDRHTFSRLLQEKGIAVSMHFIPHFNFTWFKKNLGLRAPDYPQAQAQGACSITLPLWPDMSDAMIDAVIDAVVEVGEGNRAG